MSLSMAALVALVVAAICDLFVPFVIGAFSPRYNHLTDTISTLGTRVSVVRVPASINLIVVGVSLVVFSVLQYALFDAPGVFKTLFALSVFIFGAGSIISGFYPEDPKGAPETVSGKIHGIGAGIGFLFFMSMPLFAVFFSQALMEKALFLALFALSWLFFILFISGKGATGGLLVFAGLWQRLSLATAYCVLFLVYLS